MPKPSPAPHCIMVGTAVAGATVDFTWAGDRWQHKIAVRRPAGGVAVEAWESLEGAWPTGGDPRWPASPVLVELSAVDLPQAGPTGGRAVVGVGLAGRSHFSAAVAADPDRPGAVRFEIACRLVEPPGPLGSTYRLGRQIVRIAPRDASGPLPRTVTWSYSVGPEGLCAGRGTEVSTEGS